MTINAVPQAVWPWLSQMGELPRGGFYFYDWIERLMGMSVASSEQDLPGATRLVSRVRARIAPTARGIGLLLVLNPGPFLMERKMLLGIKRRAGRPTG